MKKEILARKAPKSYLIVPVTFMILGILFVFNIWLFKVEHLAIKIGTSIPLVALGVYGTYLTFEYLFQPKVMLYYDSQNIYINCDANDTIPFSDIKNVEARHSKGGYSTTFSYGTILITTNNKNYKFSLVADVDEVLNKIENNIK